MVLILKKKDLESITLHSEESFPIEACGILGGDTQGKKKFVKKVFPTKNVLKSESKYQIDPIEQLSIFEEIENEELKILGFYHSHPYWSSFFSEIDRNEAYYRGCSYLVYSVKDKTLKSYVPREDRVEEEEIEIES